MLSRRLTKPLDPLRRSCKEGAASAKPGPAAAEGGEKMDMQQAETRLYCILELFFIRPCKPAY